MDALKPSFMLLPAFTFLPDGEIQLGTVLPVAAGSRQPDPRRPLTARINVAAARTSKFDHGPWHWNSKDALSVNGGVRCDTAMLAGAGIDGNQGHEEALEINSSSVWEESFVASEDDIKRVIADYTVARIINKLSRPSVYLVTGRMVAHGAEIAIRRGKAHGGGAHVSVDASAVGAPVGAGVEGSVKKSQERQLVESPPGPFILAYQLLRLRKKVIGGVNAETENRFALFDGDEEEDDDGDLVLSELDIQAFEPKHIEAEEG